MANGCVHHVRLCLSCAVRASCVYRVLAECKYVIADVGLQQATQQAWAVVAPVGLNYREAMLDALFMVLRALAHLCALACFPPYTKRLELERERCQAKAREDACGAIQIQQQTINWMTPSTNWVAPT